MNEKAKARMYLPLVGVKYRTNPLTWTRRRAQNETPFMNSVLIETVFTL